MYPWPLSRTKEQQLMFQHSLCRLLFIRAKPDQCVCVSGTQVFRFSRTLEPIFRTVCTTQHTTRYRLRRARGYARFSVYIFFVVWIFSLFFIFNFWYLLQFVLFCGRCSTLLLSFLFLSFILFFCESHTHTRRIRSSVFFFIRETLDSAYYS